VFGCVESQWRCSFVQYYEDFYVSFLMLKDCKISYDVWIPSIDVSQQAPRQEAWPTRAACPAGWGTPAAVASIITPDDNRVDVSHADSSSSDNRTDPDNHVASSTTTSASAESADAIDAERQACGVHERSSPCFAHSADLMDTEDWLRTVERELHTAQCNDREKVLLYSLSANGSSSILVGVLPRRPCWPLSYHLEGVQEQLVSVSHSRRPNDSKEGRISAL
jgi:hypothetical protein